MRRVAMFLALFAFCSLISTAQEKKLKRVEKFPEGEQVRHSIGSFFSGLKDYNVEQYTFNSPYESIWPAVKRAAQTFAKAGGRSIVGIDEQNGRVQNGRITENAMTGMGPGAWLDEFVIEVLKVAPDKAKVAVARKVIQKEISGKREWKTQWSNGKIEAWILTQIEDEIKNVNAEQAAAIDTSVVDTSVDYSKSAPGKYVNQKNRAEYIDLKPDGTCYLQMSKSGYICKYEITGDVITTILPDGRAGRDKIREGVLIEANGTRWVREGAAPTTSATSEVLTNEEIVRMTAAKLPDSVIVAKIKSSTCRFDTSADGLIKLKQAGVSDAVIQAIIEAASK